MTTYTITENNRIEIDFHGVKPSDEIRSKMKAVRIWWDPDRKIWHGFNNNETLAVAKEICGADYALKVKIKDIVKADKAQLEAWEKLLKDYVNDVMSEDNSEHSGNSVSKSQEFVWMDCFEFIAKHLSGLSSSDQEYELVFEYSLPGTVHERPDVFLLTNSKAISLEFKRKEAPQVDSNKDDVAQAIRYKEWLQNHHKVTKDKSIEVKSYLVCTHKNAVIGSLRGIDILTAKNFGEAIAFELNGESQCSFSAEWLASSKTEMPDMLQAIEIMYREGRIPYISDVNQNCLNKVLGYIDGARKQKKKILILINGVPGAGKTAVGQSIVYEENKNGAANAVYLSGNGPLVEVLQYQINEVGNNKHMGENAIQGMKEFKSTFFDDDTKVPEQSILIFDEAQRAWDAKKLGKNFTEPEGLFGVCERIYKERDYAVLIGLYGNGQVIYTGEEAGLLLWEDALKKHDDWTVIVSENLADKLQGLGKRKIADNDVFLPVSLRADFIDCSKWVEQAICRADATAAQAKKELTELQNTSMRICVTRDFSKVKERAKEIKIAHPEWKYGMLISNFAEQSVINKALPEWNIGFKGCNVVPNGSYGYGPWFAGGCKELTEACSVYGSQGLELDCPIVVFGGEYVRQNGKWIARGYRYDKDVKQKKYKNADTIVENNFRVLLTRARKELVLLLPRDSILDETYKYFIDMGMDEL
jgi:8-oxo-dGTP diphosphatase